MNVAVIIPAAGRSTRFGPSDKLNQDLGGRPLLMRTVELFTKRDEVRTILVAGPPETIEEFRLRFAATLSFHGATVVEGGRAGRWETVKRALEAVPDDCTHVVVHDAARPATSDEVLDRVFEAARSVAAVIPVVRISATVKRVGEAGLDVADQGDDVLAEAILGEAGRKSIAARPVIETIDRRGLVEAQTPQVFEAGLLRRAYEQDGLDDATDDAALVERLGETVHCVEGDPRNIKVTTPPDLPLVRAILGVRAPAERPAHKRF